MPIVALYDVDGFAESPGCGGAGCHGYFGAQLARGGIVVRRVVEATFSGRATLQETLQLPLDDVHAGTDIELKYSVWFIRSSNGYHGEGTGRLRFAGLPQGARVESCQGYGTAPTPARGSSWGRVKSSYRLSAA